MIPTGTPPSAYPPGIEMAGFPHQLKTAVYSIERSDMSALLAPYPSVISDGLRIFQPAVGVVGVKSSIPGYCFHNQARCLIALSLKRFEASRS